MFNFFTNLTKYREDRVYRVVVYFNGGFSVGSGFFIKENHFLTCFHVAFTKELRRLRSDSSLSQISGIDEHSKLKVFFDTHITRVEIELSDNVMILATLKDFDEKYDIALFEVSPNEKIRICTVNWSPRTDRGDYVFFGGFPSHHSYPPNKAPIAVQEGMVSSFIETQIGGEKYKHLQINSINLGGNSGAPLFEKGSKKVIGIINGNLNRSIKNVMIYDSVSGQSKPQIVGIPLAIAYATSMDILKVNTKIFN